MTTIDFPVDLPVTAWGASGADRSVLLLHGLTSAGGVWWRVAADLAAEGYRVVAPDLRGHGRAPRATSYALDALAADVLALATPSGGWDLVVGHSLGGAAAVAAAATRPGWSRALLLVDPALRRNPHVHAFIASAQAEVADPDAERYLRSNPLWHPEDAHQKVLAARAVSGYVVAHALLDTADWDVVARLADVAAPVRILGGDPERGGAAVPPPFGAELDARFATVSFVTVLGAGHSIHRDDPTRVVAEALAVLAG